MGEGQRESEGGEGGRGREGDGRVEQYTSTQIPALRDFLPAYLPSHVLSLDRHNLIVWDMGGGTSMKKPFSRCLSRVSIFLSCSLCEKELLPYFLDCRELSLALAVAVQIDEIFRS